jgi:hypothetical protein
VFYTYLDALQRRLKRRKAVRHGSPATATSVEPPEEAIAKA